MFDLECLPCKRLERELYINHLPIRVFLPFLDAAVEISQ